jgi:D-threo-aldose 1-dehydrogenase
MRKLSAQDRQDLIKERGMDQRRLGKTAVEVSTLGLGCGPLGGLFDRIDEGQANATVAAALDGGITYFDTAPFYGHGLSEHRLGTGLRRDRRRAVISTKVGRLLRPAGPGGPEPDMFRETLPFDVVHDYSRDGVLRSFEDSLQRLGTDRIDILYVHDVSRRWLGDALEDHFRGLMDGGYPALAELRAAGVVGAIGVGMNDTGMLTRLAQAGDFDVFMLAGRYTLLDQTGLDGLFQACATRGVSIVAAGPFNSGILATGARAGAKFFYADASPEILERTRRIEGVCADHGIPLATAALQFALRHPVVASVATGMVSPDEVAANVAAFAAPVPAALWPDLKTAGLLHPETPV